MFSMQHSLSSLTTILAQPCVSLPRSLTSFNDNMTVGCEGWKVLGMQASLLVY